MCTVERHAAAIRAIRDVEIERLITELRLLRSYFNKEQLQTPLLQFFQEKLPNLSISGKVEQGEIEVQWKDTEVELQTNPADGIDIHASLLHRLSMAYPNCSAGMRSLNGFEFSSKSGNCRFRILLIKQLASAPYVMFVCCNSPYLLYWWQ